LSPQEVRERIELRMLLEERALLQAAARMDARAFEELEARLVALTDAIGRNDYFEEAQADLEFHRCIWHQAGNRTLYQTLDQIAVPLFAFVSILRGARRERLTEVVQSHEGIVHALKAGDPAVVREALRQHFDYRFSLPADVTGDWR
jgi:DNA-binding GntR family transcriptional regulator